MISANLSDIESKYYVFTAFGSEGVNNEVSHAEALKRISDLTVINGFYGSCSIIKKENYVLEFIKACNYVLGKMPANQHSNIICSILSSLDENFGFKAVNDKTVINPIWISPLTNMYWYFDLDKVVKLKLFYNDVLNSNTINEVYIMKAI